MGTKTAPRVLVVDDEASLVDALATRLRHEGFIVDEAATGRRALLLAQQEQPDLIILDVMLPELDGLEIARRLREVEVSVPILFLTARETLQDKQVGLQIGEDDYVTKPVALAEVVEQVHRVLRRVGLNPGDEPVLQFADLELDETAHEVRRSGNDIALTATEFKLLRYFLLNPGQVLSKSQILDYVWRRDFFGDPNVVETYVSYLRKKLGRPPLIYTVRMVGYALRDVEADGG